MTRITSNATTGVLQSLACLAILSLLPVISNGRPEDFSALGFAFCLSIWQVVFATPAMLFARRRGSAGPAEFPPRTPGRRATAVLVGTGMVFGLSTFLFVLGMEKAGAASAAVAIQSYPVFAILLEAIFLGRRKSRLELGLTGALLLTLYYLGTGGTWRVEGFSIWFAVSLSVPLLWSIAHIIIKEELARDPVTPERVTFTRVVVSTLFLGAIVLVTEPESLPVILGRADFQLFAALMGLAYYVELLFWFYALRHIPVSLASTIVTPWPAFTMILAATLLDETVEPYQVGAFLVVATCILGLTLAGTRKPKPVVAE